MIFLKIFKILNIGPFVILGPNFHQFYLKFVLNTSITLNLTSLILFN